jgi:hypothetical protein
LAKNDYTFQMGADLADTQNQAKQARDELFA